VRVELCAESIRLALVLATLMPDEAEVHGLHALILLQDARRNARVRNGELVLLEDQDRSLWDEEEIAEGRRALDRGLVLRTTGPYQLQAAIASLHVEPETDWEQIALLYTRLLELQPSPVVELNRAVAFAQVRGPAEGLAFVDAIEGLDDYHLFHSVRAHLLRELGLAGQARTAYERAAALAPTEIERDFLRARGSAL
jgi:RNA polymerase sigma-70 factor (ECF subfamily)